MRYKMIMAWFCILVLGCTEKPIGGQKDEHGCLTGAGYSWNEDVTACIREWELDDEQKAAVKIAIAPLSYRPYTVQAVRTLSCPGCFEVILRGETEDVRIRLADWKVVQEDGPNADDCLEKGGRIANMADECKQGETSIGTVVGYIHPAICCIEINSFDDCIKAGFPIMESYPRQCRAGETTFTENTGTLTYKEARALAQNTECIEMGDLTEDYFYNENTKTWWINLEMKEPYKKENCNPACVVFEETKIVQINWRCTGALPLAGEEELLCTTKEGKSMTLREANQIAQRSECAQQGIVSANGFCNSETGTWWLEMDMFEKKEGCNPACVVFIDEARAEINWRCTGLI